MEEEIKRRQLAPTLTLTTTETPTMSKLFQVMKQFPEQNDPNNKDSFLCETTDFPFGENTPFQLYCLILNRNRLTSNTEYTPLVLQRREVVSLVLEKSYEECDLESEFRNLLQFIEENKLVSRQVFRIVFHKEKRKTIRNTLFKKVRQNIITEIQVEIEPLEAY